jgi:hypothetical protein
MESIPVLKSANTNYETADTISNAYGNNVVADFVAVFGGAWSVGAITNPDAARNLVISVKNDSGFPLNMYEGVMTFSIQGLLDGITVYDSITFTCNAGNKSVATGTYRYKYGTQPMDAVSFVTLDNVPDNLLKIGVGVGSKIWVPSQFFPALGTDAVKKVWFFDETLGTTAAKSLSGTIDITYNTFNLSGHENGTMTIQYKTEVAR